MKIAIIGAVIGALGAITAALIIVSDDDSPTPPPITETVEAAGEPSPEEEEPEAATEAEGEPDGGSGQSAERSPAPTLTRTSIVQLSEEGKAEHLGAFEGDYGTQSIGGRPYPDGVSMLVFSDGSGHPKVAVNTEGRFSKISGVVGIDGNAECVEVPASVSIVDDHGTVLWGPKTVDSRSRVPFSADLEGAVRVYLTQASLATGEEGCGANPAWGRVYLTGPAET